MKVNHRPSPVALFVHGAVQERLFRRRITGEEVTLPVELGEASRIEPAEGGVGRGEQPTIVQTYAQVPAAARRQSPIKNGTPELDDLLAQPRFVAMGLDHRAHDK